MNEKAVAGFIFMNLIGLAISGTVIYFAARAGARSACVPARGNKLRKR
jgi:hypothetical protein